MLFTSPVFFVFFAIYLVLHVRTPARYRPMLMIVGGTIFYGYWYPYYAWLPLALALLATVAARWVMQNGGAGRVRTGLVIAALLLPLAIFKYADFLAAELSRLVPGLDLPRLGLPLPLGVSFITFTLIAYVVDVRSGRYPIERNLSTVAAYTVFFPHVIAGPILRPHELMPQLTRLHPALSRIALPALTLFSIGLFKKLAIADTVGGIVDRVYADPLAVSAAAHLVAFYGFAIQIYCDFSGYTDMAIALALALGVRLPANFRQPYMAVSPIDFWRRWHMTLSRWLRDYLYIPLGGNRHGRARQIAAVIVTMTLGGLWHGAAWTFVLWGFFHGLLLAAAHAWRSVLPAVRVPRMLSILIVFHLVSVGWVLFRAPDLTTAGHVLTGPFTAPWGSLSALSAEFGFVALLIVGTLALHRWDDHRRSLWLGRRLPAVVLGPTLTLLWLLSFVLSAGESARFIYFDF